jgi:cytoskeletal protein CcmA (bactofilin family)
MKGRIRSLDTYVGEETFLEGNLTSKKNLCIYGSVSGSIECQGRVVIGETGNVEADILADEVVVSGKVMGNVTAKSKLEMASTGVIQGDIKTSHLIMEDGSKFDGHCEMLFDGKPAVMGMEKIETADISPALTSQEQPKLPPSTIHD